tara:strand:+ start:166 stop:804 length:639 start_codon:yes stop_codon:yes gene_type:complete
MKITINKDWEVLNGPYNIMLKNLKSRFPNHLSIVQFGSFYQLYDEDATFFVNRFSRDSFTMYNKLITVFPTFSTKYFSDLRDMEKSFVRVDQLSEKKNGKIQRAISEIYNGRNGDKTPAISSSSPAPTDTTKRRTTWHKNTPKPLSSKNLPKSRTSQHTSSSRGAPGKPRVTNIPKETDDYPKQYIDEPLGTREDHYKMKGRQSFKNKTDKH